MRAEVARDWGWANHYLPEVREILRVHLAPLISDARLGTVDEDLKQGTDIVLQTEVGSVGVRIRDVDVWSRDFSIRSQRSNGAETEMDKWLNGIHPRWYFTGWARDETSLADWVILEVPKIIESRLIEMAEDTWNGDGTAARYLPVRQLEVIRCVVARAQRPPRTRPRDDPRLFS